MRALTCAGYEYMKLMVAELQRQLNEIEKSKGIQIITGANGAKISVACCCSNWFKFCFFFFFRFAYYAISVNKLFLFLKAFNGFVRILH